MTTAMDRITIHGLEVWARHGVEADERARGQPFVVHVTIEADLAAAAERDELSATVDYSKVARDAADAAAQGPYDLIETVADRVARAVLAHPGADAVEVTVEKPHAPLPTPAAGVSVTLRRERKG